MSSSSSEYYNYRGNSFITNTSFKVRKRIYDLFYSEFGSCQRIADVGVTSENVSAEANVLEALFPDKSRITAIGIEDAQHLERDYPGLKFVKVQTGKALPFVEGEFDVVYSHAVIEHVVDPHEREFFLRELLRIGRNVFITTPNKYFVIEPHTFVPFLHFLFPRLFYWLLDKKIANRFYNSGNLKLLDAGDFMDLATRFPGWEFEIKKVHLFGMVSNLILVGRRKDAI